MEVILYALLYLLSSLNIILGVLYINHKLYYRSALSLVVAGVIIYSIASGL